MHHLPIFMDVKQRTILVVGGGAVAARKAEAVLKAGGRVRIVAAEIEAEIEALLDDANVSLLRRRFEAADLDGPILVICATDDEQLNQEVSALAQRADVPVNVVDRLELCTFIMPAIVDRSPMLIAITTGGEAPILSRIYKARLETCVPAGLGRLAEMAGRCRSRINAAIPDGAARRRFWERFAEGPIAEYVFAGQTDSAEELLDQTLRRVETADGPPVHGEVYLVGAGPGDPDLLTFRAIRLMQQADVVLHDRLVPDAILDMVRRDAERVFVGKKRAEHALRQEEISRLMVDLARQGKRVLRLKGGDPFTFGRGGEEIEALAAEGIHFQVVPGVTSANGCAAYAGIPLTHRDHAQSCTFVTGHTKDGTLDLNWPTLAQPQQTVVVFMGLNSLAELSEKLIAHGADPKTLAAIIDNGTRPNQRVVTANLETLAEAAAAEALTGPTIVIIGSVVSLRDNLIWFRGADNILAPGTHGL